MKSIVITTSAGELIGCNTNTAINLPGYKSATYTDDSKDATLVFNGISRFQPSSIKAQAEYIKHYRNFLFFDLAGQVIRIELDIEDYRKGEFTDLIKSLVKGNTYHFEFNYKS